MDEALLQKQGEVYAVAGVDENQPAQLQKKRKGADSNDQEVGIPNCYIYEENCS